MSANLNWSQIKALLSIFFSQDAAQHWRIFPLQFGSDIQHLCLADPGNVAVLKDKMEADRLSLMMPTQSSQKATDSTAKTRHPER